MKKLLFALAALSGLCSAQVALSPVPRLQFLDKNGKPLSGGLVYTYASGTSTPLATYTDATGTVQNANPVVLDSAGSASIWLSYTSYRFVVKTSAGVQQYLQDNISPSSAVGLFSSANTWSTAQTFSGGVTIGTVQLGDDNATPGNLTVSGNIGDAANPVPALTALNVTVQNQVATNQLQGSSTLLLGQPVTAPTGASSIGGAYVTCPAPLSTLSPAPDYCVPVNIGGNSAYAPVWKPSAPSTVLPTPPSTATVFSSLQLASGNPGTWTICNANNSCSAGTPTGLGTASTTFGVASPSQSGAALKATNTTNSGSPTGWNTLWYRHLGSPTANPVTGISNMLEDFYVYVTPGTSITGYEFDPDLGTGTWAYKASIACYASAAKWYIYDSFNHAWNQTASACNWNTTGANAWHHVQLWISFDQTAHQYTYKALVVDGSTVWSVASPPSVGPTYGACGSGCSGNTSLGSNVNVEMQIDNGSTATTSYGYYDNWSITVW